MSDRKDEVKNRSSCVEVAEKCGAEMKLRATGEYDRRGPCPICQLGRAPLCTRAESWFCHGCKSGGDVFDLVIHLRMADDLPGAIEFIDPSSAADDAAFIAATAKPKRMSAADIWAGMDGVTVEQYQFLDSRGIDHVKHEFKAGPCGPALPLYSPTGEIINILTRAIPGASCQACAGADRSCGRCEGSGKEPKTSGLSGRPGKALLGCQPGDGPLILCEGWADYATARLLAPKALVRGVHGAGNMEWAAGTLADMARDRGVVILAHDDSSKKINAGMDAARRAAAAFVRAGVEASKVLLWTNPGGDLNDWLMANPGASRAPWLDAAAPFPLEGEDMKAPAGPYTRTDAGNANRWADMRGKDFKYSAKQDQWYRWSGQRWDLGYPQRDVTRSAKELAEELHAAAEQSGEKKDMRWHHRSMAAGRISAVARLAQAQPSVQIDPDDLDKDDFSLNASNGTIDLRTGELRPHRREDLITTMTPIVYDPDATCPNFVRFLDQVFAPHPDAIEFLCRWAGYCLTGDISAQSLVFCHGDGGNGKGVLMRTISALLGDLHMAMNFAMIVNRRDGRGADNNILYLLARMRNKRLCTVPEVKKDEPIGEDLVNSLTGGDEIQARFSHGNFFEYKPKFKLMLSSNGAPKVDGTDEGIWRRLLFLPFDVSFRGDKRDDTIEAKLRTELPGILAWAVRGCRAWLADGGGRAGLAVPASISKATAQLRTDTDLVADFLTTHVRVEEGAKTPAAQLYARYEKWAKAQRVEVSSAREIGRRVSAIFGIKSSPVRMGDKSVRVYQGLAI